MKNITIQNCYTFKIKITYSECVFAACFTSYLQSALDINWDVLTEHTVTWAGYQLMELA